MEDRRTRIVHQHRHARGAGDHLAGPADDERPAAREVNRRVRPPRHRSVHPDDLIGIGVREIDEVVATLIRVRKLVGRGRVLLLDPQTLARVGDVDARRSAGDARALGDAHVDGAVPAVGQRVIGADAVASGPGGRDGAAVHGDADVADVALVEQGAHRGLVGVGETRVGVVELGVQPGVRHHRLQHRLLLVGESLRQDVPEQAPAGVGVHAQIRHEFGVAVAAVVIGVDGGCARNRGEVGIDQRLPELRHDRCRPRLGGRVGRGGVEQRRLGRGVGDLARIVALRHFFRRVAPGQGMGLDARCPPVAGGGADFQFADDTDRVRDAARHEPVLVVLGRPRPARETSRPRDVDQGLGRRRPRLPRRAGPRDRRVDARAGRNRPALGDLDLPVLIVGMGDPGPEAAAVLRGERHAIGDFERDGTHATLDRPHR